MTLVPVEFNAEEYPVEFHQLMFNVKLYDSSCSNEARVIFIDKDGGYFLKSAPKGSLEYESIMTKYFHTKGLAANVLAYISSPESVSDDRDWLLTEKIHGEDGTGAKYREQPERLCDIWGERLAMLHETDFTDCPVMNHTKRRLERAKYNKCHDTFDKSHFPDSWGYKNAEEAWDVIETRGHLLRTDTLLHGDYCLPNIILDDWRFSSFIDLGSGGVGDRHVDLFWGMWTLAWNLHTDKYHSRFIDAYGRDKVDKNMLRVVAAVEVFEG